MRLTNNVANVLNTWTQNTEPQVMGYPMVVKTRQNTETRIMGYPMAVKTRESLLLGTIILAWYIRVDDFHSFT